MKRPRWIAVVAMLGAVATFVAGALLIPRPPQLSAESRGDSALVDEVGALLAAGPGVRDRVSVAVIEGSDVRTAHFGAADDTEYEIGSVTKTVTGSLLADAIARGEVEQSTRLGDLLDLGDSAAASVTLGELATQSSGLPRLPTNVGSVLPSLVAVFRAGDPYGSTVADLESDAKASDVGEKEFLYSNFGFALLGQALVVAAGAQSYAELARERVFEPLDMRDSYAPATTDDLRESATTGFTATGRPSDPWTMAADGPAGSVRSTLADMVVYTRAQLDATAPGADATTARTEIGELGRIGLAWITTDDVTWHNGQTGGFTSWVGFDRESDRAVVVLSNTAVSVDDIGFALMEAN
ncbi:serine hydrolase domain-containing protein [Conyzicola sp.]|uniref:serine hydrolase domain-containing protein n=1 Tax=Conyzicola sp. TaxID=1969404 RepID=UPI0039898F3D